MREYRVVLDNRNALLQQNNIDQEAYFVWTKKLWEYTSVIQVLRKQLLADLEVLVNHMLHKYIDPNLFLAFTYQAKKGSDLPFDSFWDNNHGELLRQELHFKRTLFGAHVDDFIITLEGKKSRA